MPAHRTGRGETFTSEKRSAVTVDNTICELDAHVGEPRVDHPQYNQPVLEVDTIERIIESLERIDAKTTAAEFQILWRHLRDVDDPEAFVPRYTAQQLSAMLVPLVIARATEFHLGNFDHDQAIQAFGRLIDESCEAVLTEAYETVEIDGIVNAGNKAMDDPHEFDPLRVVAGDHDVRLEEDVNDNVSG